MNNQISEKNPDWFTKKLWWFSTAIESIIKDCTTDRNRYKIIGLAVMFTWLYATLAWTFFWSTNTASPWVYIPLGIFMGFFILAIDRVLIASINKQRKNALAIVLRMGLALAIGAFLAQPIILFIYSSDINREVPLLLDKKKVEKKKEIDGIYSLRKQELLTERNNLDSSLSRKKQEMNIAEQEYLKEIDGTGGSGKYGIGGIAQQKQQTFLLQKAQYDSLVKTNGAIIGKTNAQLDSIESSINTAFADYNNSINDRGFLIKKEAMESLFKKDSTGSLEKQYYLLLLILTLFELIPIISKIFLPTGTYDAKLLMQDNSEMGMHQHNVNKSMDYKMKFNDIAEEYDSDLAKAFYEASQNTRKERMQENIKTWRNNPNESFGEFWEKTKDDLFSNPEQ